jgi:phosphonate transport system permease protein
LVLAGLAALGYVDIDLGAIAASHANAANFLGRVGALEFPAAGNLIHQTALTLGIVLLGTLLAAALSVPVAFLAARNTAPNRRAQALGRFIGVFARAMPDVVLAMVFALVFSLGALPGILAIGLHSVGMISRLFADAIEQIDEGPRLAIRAAGGSKLQERTAGIIPQVMPSWLATTLHRADINLRGSVILGYVGVPGLGMEMRNAFGALNYSRGLAIAVVIFGLCLGMEALSSAVRRRMLGQERTGPSRTRRDLIGRVWTRRSRSGRVWNRSNRTSRASRNRSRRTLAPRVWTGPAWTRRTRPAERTASAIRVADAAEPDDRSARPLDAYLVRPWSGARLRRAGAWGLAGLTLLGALAVCKVNVTDLWTVWPQVPQVAAKFWPPTTGVYGLGRLMGALMETVAVAGAAALVTFAASLAVGSLAARNVAPRPWARTASRTALVVVRGIPELVAAILLIVVTGLGTQAGTLALAFCHIGLLGKLIADSFEELPRGPQRALTATGASRLQVYVAGVLAPGRRAVVGHALYVFDTNIRAATLLGIVGGGGIGYYLLVAGQGSNYGQVTLIVVMIVAVVMALEALTMWLRQALA